MDSSRVYNEESRQHVVDSMKDSREQTADSMKGKSLSTVYCQLSTKRSSLPTVYRLLSPVYCPLSTERGLALVMVLVLSAILLAIMAGLIYMVISGTQISGMQKRYKTALEAALGGADVTYQMIAARGNPNIPGLSNFLISASSVGGYDCLNDKLNKKTSDWNSVCSSILTIDPNIQSTYDMRFDLGSVGYPTYRVYTKIVDTVVGNSGGDEGLIKSGVVSSGTGEVTVMSIPYLYTIELQAQNLDNPQERAKLSILYQY